MNLPTPLMPALLAFGPLFMVIGLQPHGTLWIAFLGGLMVSFSTLSLFNRQQRLMQKMEQSEK